MYSLMLLSQTPFLPLEFNHNTLISVYMSRMKKKMYTKFTINMGYDLENIHEMKSSFSSDMNTWRSNPRLAFFDVI